MLTEATESTEGPLTAGLAKKEAKEVSFFNSFPRVVDSVPPRGNGAVVPVKPAKASSDLPVFQRKPENPPKVTVLSRPKTLEICAGSGGLSLALWKKGFDATGIDWQGNRHSTRIPLVTRDLTDPQQQKEVEEIRKSANAIHLAPPCGTASAARGFPLSEEDKAKGLPQPKPLRTLQEPWGKDNLSPQNQVKVDKANIIYLFCIQTIIWCCTRVPVIPFTLENPIRSLLWALPPMKEVIKKFKLALLNTHMCMLGSERRKESGILTNRPDVYANLVKHCDGTHEHKAWGAAWNPVTKKWGFATGEECEYPNPFCDCLANCLADHYDTEHRQAPKTRSKRPKPRQNRLRTRAQVGHQSRRL